VVGAKKLHQTADEEQTFCTKGEKRCRISAPYINWMVLKGADILHPRVNEVPTFCIKGIDWCRFSAPYPDFIGKWGF